MQHYGTIDYLEAERRIQTTRERSMAVLRRVISCHKAKNVGQTPKEKNDMDEDLYETHIKCYTGLVITTHDNHHYTHVVVVANEAQRN